MKFPSGSSVTVYTTHYYSNIYVDIPSDDFNCTVGLCGTFDGNRLNDFKDKAGNEFRAIYNSIAPEGFSESWKYAIEISFEKV